MRAWRLFVATLAASLLTALVEANCSGQKVYATCVFRPAYGSNVTGSVDLSQSETFGCFRIPPIELRVDVTGLPDDGVTEYALHVMTYGDLNSGCVGSGYIYNPPPANPNAPARKVAVGNLGNLQESAGGRIRGSFVSDTEASLDGSNSILGRAALLYNLPFPNQQPARPLACCVIGHADGSRFTSGASLGSPVVLQPTPASPALTSGSFPGYPAPPPAQPALPRPSPIAQPAFPHPSPAAQPAYPRPSPAQPFFPRPSPVHSAFSRPSPNSPSAFSAFDAPSSPTASSSIFGSRSPFSFGGGDRPKPLFSFDMSDFGDSGILGPSITDIGRGPGAPKFTGRSGDFGSPLFGNDPRIGIPSSRSRNPFGSAFNFGSFSIPGFSEDDKSIPKGGEEDQGGDAGYSAPEGGNSPGGSQGGGTPSDGQGGGGYNPSSQYSNGLGPSVNINLNAPPGSAGQGGQLTPGGVSGPAPGGSSYGGPSPATQSPGGYGSPTTVPPVGGLGQSGYDAPAAGSQTGGYAPLSGQGGVPSGGNQGYSVPSDATQGQVTYSPIGQGQTDNGNAGQGQTDYNPEDQGQADYDSGSQGQNSYTPGDQGQTSYNPGGQGQAGSPDQTSYNPADQGQTNYNPGGQGQTGYDAPPPPVGVQGQASYPDSGPQGQSSYTVPPSGVQDQAGYNGPVGAGSGGQAGYSVPPPAGQDQGVYPASAGGGYSASGPGGYGDQGVGQGPPPYSGPSDGGASPPTADGGYGGYQSSPPYDGRYAGPGPYPGATQPAQPYAPLPDAAPGGSNDTRSLGQGAGAEAGSTQSNPPTSAVGTQGTGAYTPAPA